MSSSRRDRAEGQQRMPEAERYRQAASDALQQLDWCIGYLHGIRKPRISRALARNRSVIRGKLLTRPEEPLPTAHTDE